MEVIAMRSALRLVRSGVLFLMIGFTLPAAAGGILSASTATSAVPTAQDSQPVERPRSQAAVMDLWLAASLSLILLYVRRRRREGH